MTPELGPSTRALLEAARGGAPDAAAIARMRGKIDAAVAGAPAVATSATASGALAGKLGLIALAVIVATGAVVLATRPRSIDPISGELAAPVIEPQVQTVREAAPPVVEEQPEIEMPAAARPLPPRAGKPSEAPRKAIELAREVELVDHAIASLRSGDARAALAAVRVYTVEAGQRGQLAEDAAAVEIEALCALGDRGATSKRAAFEVRWPASVQHAKLDRACR